jgi:hypothetical protein
VQIRFSNIELKLNRFHRGGRQTLVEQHPFAQVAARNIERVRRIANVGVMVDKHISDRIDIQMRDGGRQRHG